MRCWKLMLLLLTIALPLATASAADMPAINVSGFRSGTGHWRKFRSDDRLIRPLLDQPSYEPEQVREIVENILLFQRSNGGWPKNYDLLAQLTDEQREQIAATRDRDDTSFDNSNTYPQVEYLARAAMLLDDSRLRPAALRGVDFMLDAQRPNGGIPQSHPRASGYHAQITFNDGVMIGVLSVLKDIADGNEYFQWIDDARRNRARQVVARGVECTLKCQIVVDGRPTGWCQQHDRNTYEPVGARTFELASICPQDTTEIVQFLSTIEPRDPRIDAAIENAVAWLQKVPIKGVRVDRVATSKVEFDNYTSEYDVLVIEDPQARPIWARHYEIGTDRPIFAGRDGVKKYRLADIERERRSGTPWYGYWPAKLTARNAKD